MYSLTSSRPSHYVLTYLAQAFGSNIFNVCIALGFVWLLQCAMPNCQYGKAEATQSIWGACTSPLTPTLTLTPIPSPYS